MLTFEELDKAARMIARTAPLDDQDDVYQDAWERFLKYPPQKIDGARMMARCARDDLWRLQRKRRHDQISEEYFKRRDPTTEDAIRRLQIAAVPREIVRIVIASGRGAPGEPAGVCVRDRVRLHRWRQSQVQEGEKT